MSPLHLLMIHLLLPATTMVVVDGTKDTVVVVVFVATIATATAILKLIVVQK
jgi:hypothetical protein